MTDDIVLEPATIADAEVLANLLEHYLHDMSEIFPIEVRADGRFGYDKLPLYWSQQDRRFPFLIRCGALVAGFAFAALTSPVTDDPPDFDVAEFFVLRRHRRSGVGQRAATLLWDLHRGRWIVRVSEGNRAGVPFWRSVIREYSLGGFCETRRPGNPHGWRVFSFLSRKR